MLGCFRSIGPYQEWHGAGLVEFDRLPLKRQTIENLSAKNLILRSKAAPHRLGLRLTRTSYTDRPEDPMMKPEILERQIAHAGYVTVERLRMRLTDGAEVSREVERHGECCCGAALRC
jgi:hypothetical protein